MVKHDIRNYVYTRDFFSCQKCGGVENLGIAHRIKSGKGTQKYIKNFMISKYNITLNMMQVNQIINDPLNLILACNGDCNDSFNIFNKPVQRDELLQKIIYKLGFVNA